RNSERQVAGELAQELDFFSAERVRLRSINHECAKDFGIDEQRNGNARRIASLQRLVAPWRQRRIGGDVFDHDSLPSPDAGPRWPLTSLCILPRQVQCAEIAFLNPGLRDWLHRLK